MTRPRMVLLDEPMAGVAPTLAIQLLEHIIDLRTTRRHDHPRHRARHGGGMAISDRIVVMDEGAVIAEGPEEIQRNERVIGLISARTPERRRSARQRRTHERRDPILSG